MHHIERKKKPWEIIKIPKSRTVNRMRYHIHDSMKHGLFVRFILNQPLNAIFRSFSFYYSFFFYSSLVFFRLSFLARTNHRFSHIIALTWILISCRYPLLKSMTNRINPKKSFICDISCKTFHSMHPLCPFYQPNQPNPVPVHIGILKLKTQKETFEIQWRHKPSTNKSIWFSWMKEIASNQSSNLFD